MLQRKEEEEEEEEEWRLVPRDRTRALRDESSDALYYYVHFKKKSMHEGEFDFYYVNWKLNFFFFVLEHPVTGNELLTPPPPPSPSSPPA